MIHTSHQKPLTTTVVASPIELIPAHGLRYSSCAESDSVFDFGKACFWDGIKIVGGQKMLSRGKFENADLTRVSALWTNLVDIDHLSVLCSHYR